MPALPAIEPTAPNWDGFLSKFLLPGNPLYNSLATAAQASSAETLEHWGNIRLGLLSEYVRSKVFDLSTGEVKTWLELSWLHLLFLLDRDGQQLPADTIAAFESLREANNLY
jgi:hypothetical protein